MLSSRFVPRIAVCLLAVMPAMAVAESKPAWDCAEGLRSYPQLKSWVSRLKNFAAPVEAGRVEGSFLYAIGATLSGPGALEAWKKASADLRITWKKDDGSLDSRALSALVPKTMSGISDNGGWEALWKTLMHPLEKELLTSCGSSRCKIKFNDKENAALVSVPAASRETKFWEVISARLEAFRVRGEVYSYEKTSSPIDLNGVPRSAEAPIHEPFFVPSASDRLATFFEVLDADPSQKRVSGIYNRTCRPGSGPTEKATVCQDLVLYNNHYFDFWARQVVFFPWCGGFVVVAYETADVDEFKGAKLAQILFGVELKKLLEIVLETRIRYVHMLGF